MKIEAVKILFLLAILFGNRIVYANNINDNNLPNTPNVQQKEENITLDGMIGPYDPSDPDKGNDPDFSDVDPSDLEGELPVNYYTIAVTVPTKMEFTVFHGFGRGQFYSPEYTIANLATRPVHISVKALEYGNNVETQEYVPLHLTTPTPYNGSVEMELYLALLNKSTNIYRRVQLSDFDSNNSVSNRYLGSLALKESGILKFDSTAWDVPGLDENLNKPNKYAKADFSVTLEFSLQDPNQPTPPEESTNPVDPNPPVEGEGDTNTDTVG